MLHKLVVDLNTKLIAIYFWHHSHMADGREIRLLNSNTFNEIQEIN